jgi:hypothetical protein
MHMHTLFARATEYNETLDFWNALWAQSVTTVPAALFDSHMHGASPNNHLLTPYVLEWGSILGMKTSAALLCVEHDKTMRPRRGRPISMLDD